MWGKKWGRKKEGDQKIIPPSPLLLSSGEGGNLLSKMVLKYNMFKTGRRVIENVIIVGCNPP